MNKKEISMKKGQKVRILRTNQVATIVEVELIRKGGKVHRYCHLKVDNKPDLWLDSSELGGLVERCRITFHDDRGQELYFDVEHDIDRTSRKPQGASRNQYSDGRNVPRWF